MNNEKITVLSVGRGAADLVHSMSEEKVPGVDFAITSGNDGIPDCLTESVTSFHVPDVHKCGDIVRERFSDTDLLFIISASHVPFDVFLASEISGEARAIGIITVGIIFLDHDTIRFKCPGFTDHFKKFYDTVFFRFDYDCERIFLYAKRLVECIAYLITKSGYVNLNFEDIEAILKVTGVAGFGTGYFGGCNKCRNAVIEAVHSVMMMEGSDRILVNITTDSEVTLDEMMDAVKVIEEAAKPDAQVIWGHVIDESLNDCVCVSLIAN